MRWFRFVSIIASATSLAVVTGAAQTAAGTDEARVRALVKSIYARYNAPSISAMGPLPEYSPTTEALYKEYNVLTKDEEFTDLGGFDHYCECQDFDEKAARLLSVTIVRVAPDLIDATARYVIVRDQEPKTTRIRFQKTGSWKIHDIFWYGEGSLRGTLTETIAQYALASKASATQPPAGTQQSVNTAPVSPAMPTQSVSACGDNPRCAEVSTFVATVTDLRESGMNANQSRLIDVTVRFHNSTAGQLVLGYVSGSAIVTDDRGNRYTIFSYGGNGVRGIGEIGGNGAIDPKFALRAGESGDARFEFLLNSRGAVLGTNLVVELAVREIESLPGNQWQLAREHALQFRGFGEAATPAAATAAATPPAAAPATPPVDDACAKRPECFSAGSFLAEITRFSTSQPTPQAHAIQFSVRFRNLTAQPLVLAHTSRSTLIVDDQGNRYTPIWTNITEVRGMGAARGMESDPSFVLKPGASREATFEVQFVPPRQVRIGTTYNVDFAIEELEVLPGNQVRSARQYAVGFHDVQASKWRGIRSLFDVQIIKKSP